MDQYEHRQYGPWYVMFLILGLGVFAITGLRAARDQIDFAVALLLALVGAAFLFVASAFVYLEVRDEGDRLSVRFGPLPMFGASIPYEAIESVQPARTTMLYGFGMQGLPGLFLVMNIWGFDAVQIRLKKRRGIWRAKTLIIGTDGPDELLEFLQDKIRTPATSSAQPEQ